jgi:ABC-2 type transport system ATP-binding protein
MAVNNISLDVQKGEVLGFLGPKAAGKSTTVKMEGGRVVFGVEEADRNNLPINLSLIEGGLHIVELCERVPSLEHVY